MNEREELDKIVNEYRGDSRIVDRLIEAGYSKFPEMTGHTLDEWLETRRPNLGAGSWEQEIWNAALASMVPLPKTVDLTVEEKLQAVFDAILLENVLSEQGVWHKIADALAAGTTIDELCQRYGVKTTREV